MDVYAFQRQQAPSLCVENDTLGEDWKLRINVVEVCGFEVDVKRQESAEGQGHRNPGSVASCANGGPQVRTVDDVLLPSLGDRAEGA